MPCWGGDRQVQVPPALHSKSLLTGPHGSSFACKATTPALNYAPPHMMKCKSLCIAFIPSCIDLPCLLQIFYPIYCKNIIPSGPLWISVFGNLCGRLLRGLKCRSLSQNSLRGIVLITCTQGAPQRSSHRVVAKESKS